MCRSLPGRAVLALFALASALAGRAASAQPFDLTQVGAGPRGDTANGEHEPARLSSADGRYVVFDSSAPDLVADAVDVNGRPDVFLYDRVEDSITLVTHRADDANRAVGGIAGEISADGRWLVYIGGSRDLVAGVVDRPPSNNTYLYDRTTNSSVLVSHEAGAPLAPAGNSNGIQLSADGRFVLYQSGAQTLVPGFVDHNFSGTPDVFLFDRDTGTNVLVSSAAGTSTETANDRSDPVALSPNGAWILIASAASDLVAGLADGNGADDVYLYSRASGTNVLVSRALGSPTQTANDFALAHGVSDDGRVLYSTDATNVRAALVDTNADSDVFVFDPATGQSTLVTHAPGAPNTTQNGGARGWAFSPDARFVAFETGATNVLAGVVDGNNQRDCYSIDLATDTTVLVSRSALAANVTANGRCQSRAAVGSDGRYLAYLTSATNVLAGVVDANDRDDVYLFDRTTGTTALASHAAGIASTTADDQANLNAGSVSADGAWVTYTTRARNAIADVNDLNGADDVLLYERDTGTSRLVTRSARAARVATPGVVFDATPNGRWLTFVSDQAIAGTADANATTDAFLYDRDNRRLALLSVRAGTTTDAANGATTPGAITPDGNWITLQSAATDLVAGTSDGNSAFDAFLRDRSTGTTTLLSHAAGSATTTANDLSTPCAISDDHRYVVLLSHATNLVAGQSDANAGGDLFVLDLATGATTLATHATASATTAANEGSSCAGSSPDGRWLVYRSGATNLVPGFVDAGNTDNVYLYDRTSGTSQLVSHAAGSATTGANGSSDPVAISTDGRWIAFDSRGTDLVAGTSDSNGVDDVFLYDRIANASMLVSRNGSSAQVAASGASHAVAMSADGSRLLLRTDASDLLAGVNDLNGRSDAYVYDRGTGARTLVSRHVGMAGATADCASLPGALSADGNRVVFASNASDLVAGALPGVTYPGCEFLIGDQAMSVYVFELDSGTATLVSHAFDDPLRTGNASAVVASRNAISADGSVFAFISRASDLVTDMIDGNEANDAFIAALPRPLLFADDFEP